MDHPPLHSLIIVEDDQRLASLIMEYMNNHGFDSRIESRGDTAVNTILRQQPDVIILDLMLPGIDGFEVCRHIRSDYTGMILMLTAQDEDIDQIVGLELGADDYVIKPVEPRVLLARIKNLLRRKIPENEKKPPQPDYNNYEITSGSLTISLNNRSVFLNGQEVRLTTGEFDLLWYLASHAGTIVTRDSLYQALCGIEYDGLDRSMDIRISRLRKLLNDKPDNPQQIKTIRGKGYLFTECKEVL
jgi:DNA-binding response OmpR family regulator